MPQNPFIPVRIAVVGLRRFGRLHALTLGEHGTQKIGLSRAPERQRKTNVNAIHIGFELVKRWAYIAKSSPGRTRSYSIRIGPAFNLDCSSVVSLSAGAMTGKITLALDCTRVAFAMPMLPRICPGVRPERAIRATLPKGTAQRHRHVFELARALKAISTLADANGKALRGIVKRWHTLALPEIGTKAFDDTWFDFLEGWGKVRFPKGSEPMAIMFAAAIKANTPAEAEQYEQEKLRLLVTLCRELQRSAGGGPFFLSARKAARLLGIDPATAARWLRGLRHDGILHLAEAGNREARKANSYRYLAGV